MLGTCGMRAGDQVSYGISLIQKIAAESALKLVWKNKKNVIPDSRKASLNLMPLIPKLMWKVVRDRVDHRPDWWGSLDSVQQRETHASSWDLHLRTPGLWLVFWFTGLEFVLWSAQAMCFFITCHVFTVGQWQMSGCLRCESLPKLLLHHSRVGRISYRKSGALFYSFWHSKNNNKEQRWSRRLMEGGSRQKI